MVKVAFNDSYLECCGRIFGAGASVSVSYSCGRVVSFPYSLLSVRQSLIAVRRRLCSDSSLAAVVVRGASGVPVFCVYRA